MPNTYTTSTSTEYKFTLPSPNWLNDKDAVKVTFTQLKRASACDNTAFIIQTMHDNYFVTGIELFLDRQMSRVAGIADLLHSWREIFG